MKKKIIALTLAASVMLAGAGYAFWTDNLTISNTVSTGEFDVKFVSASTGGRTDAPADPDAPGLDIDGVEWGKYVYSDAYIGKHSGLTAAEKDLMKTVVSEDGKSVTAHIGNLYPGSSANLQVEVVNDGTIPAMFDYATVEVTGPVALQQALVYWLYYKVVDQDPTTPDVWERQYFTDVTKYEENLNKLLEDVRLEPDQTLVLGGLDPEGDNMENTFSFRLPTGVTNETGVEKASITFDMEIHWKQHNAPNS
jgi:predicted ribosomally synthesized peptide with SipW-like signal peptide